LLAFGLAGHGAAAQAADSYPSRPVRLIVSFPPGGSTDTVGRAMQPHLERVLGQSIVFENRGGAGGVIGLDAVAKAAPDGYTIGLGAAGALAINVGLGEKMPFDPLVDLAPISGLAQSPFLLAAPLSSPYASVREVIADARRNPGSLSIGHGGNGTAMDLSARLLNHMAQVSITLVPYRGTGPATQDALAGHIPLAITDMPSSFALVQAKAIKILGVTSAGRVSSLPDVPTFAESGLPGYEAVGWFGFVAPAGTPAEIVAKLDAAIVTALQDPDVQARIHAMGAEPMPFSPAEFGRFIRSETEKWAKVIAATEPAKP
jgi:tripartite-type tricarboxylate transporter receptor subunit TctC